MTRFMRSSKLIISLLIIVMILASTFMGCTTKKSNDDAVAEFIENTSNEELAKIIENADFLFAFNGTQGFKGVSELSAASVFNLYASSDEVQDKINSINGGEGYIEIALKDFESFVTKYFGDGYQFSPEDVAEGRGSAVAYDEESAVIYLSNINGGVFWPGSRPSSIGIDYVMSGEGHVLIGATRSYIDDNGVTKLQKIDADLKITSDGGYNYVSVEYENAKPEMTIEERREFIFDVSLENWFSLVPEFEYGDAPKSASEYLWYACMLRLSKGADKPDDFYMSKEYVEDVINAHFITDEIIHEDGDKGWTYTGDGYEPVPMGYGYGPLYGLEDMAITQENGRTIFDVDVSSYYIMEFDSFSVYNLTIQRAEEWDELEGLSPEVKYLLEKKGDRLSSGEISMHKAIKELFAEQDIDTFTPWSRENFRFYIDDETGGAVFLSHRILE